MSVFTVYRSPNMIYHVKLVHLTDIILEAILRVLIKKKILFFLFQFLDDDNKCYLEINYTFDIKKEWLAT